MRVIALLATYNERRFVAPCIEHLRRHGVEVYLIDNCSTDDTVGIAERYLDRGVIGIETLPRHGVSDLRARNRRKEQLARELQADWFIHLDADEIRLPPAGGSTLLESLEAVDRQGYNAVNFLELTFVPTREDPDHDHAGFHRTMRTYYPFLPKFPHRLNAWKAAAEVELGDGHRVKFPGLRMYPQSFRMKHYLFLSVDHAVEKYVRQRYDQAAVDSGWHGWRASIDAGEIRLPSLADVRVSRTDDDLDPSAPRVKHYIDEPWTGRP